MPAMDLNAAIEKQLKNIETRTGKTIASFKAEIAKTGLTKHGQILAYLKEHHGMGHGDANAVAKQALAPVAASSEAEPDDLYSGPKAHLKPIHEKLMAEFSKWGEFEVHPKKGYVALRRKKQFAMLGPATNSRVELGLNMKGVLGTDRLVEQVPGGMCQYKVKVTSADECDAELFGWAKTAFDSAG
jgi:hypothetical protein